MTLEAFGLKIEGTPEEIEKCLRLLGGASEFQKIAKQIGDWTKPAPQPVVIPQPYPMPYVQPWPIYPISNPTYICTSGALVTN